MSVKITLMRVKITLKRVEITLVCIVKKLRKTIKNLYESADFFFLKCEIHTLSVFSLFEYSVFEYVSNTFKCENDTLHLIK
jgi:hypothetical protein